MFFWPSPLAGIQKHDKFGRLLSQLRTFIMKSLLAFLAVSSLLVACSKKPQPMNAGDTTLAAAYQSIAETQAQVDKALIEHEKHLNKVDHDHSQCSQLFVAQTRLEQQMQKVRAKQENKGCLLYTSPSPRDGLLSRMPSSA